MCRSDPQSVRNALERPKRHALATGFEPVEMRSVESCEFRKLILSDPQFLAGSLDVLAHGSVDVLQSTCGSHFVGGRRKDDRSGDEDAQRQMPDRHSGQSARQG